MHTLMLLGELDRTSTVMFEAAIERLCETEIEGIELDLSDLSNIDATGVAVIAFRCRWCQRRGYEFAITPGPPAVQHVFELSAAGRCLPFLAHEPAACEPSADESRAPTGVTLSAIAYAPTSERAQGQVAAAQRPRSYTLLRVSGRGARARRRRRARGGP
jgi:anti-anti-sigma factor